MTIELIVAELEAGRPVVVPTDTVYGLAARAADHDAVATIFAVKRRPVDTRVAALVADRAQAEELVELGPDGTRLADAFWPGALTIVAPRRAGVDLAVGDDTTIGVRCPDSPLVRDLARRVGPIAATSANRHGQPTPTTASAVVKALPEVDTVIDGGELNGGASTVVSVLDGIVVLRDGPILEAELMAACDLDDR